MRGFTKAKLMLVNSEEEEAIYLPICDYSLSADRNGTSIEINSKIVSRLEDDTVKRLIRALGIS